MRYLVYLTGFFILLPFSVAAFSVEKYASGHSEERRLALVMGNSRYDGFDDLPNVKNDTGLISSKLETLGFETKIVLNASRKEMLLSIRKFGEQLEDNDVGLFYYAGHAVQEGSLNYMIPSKNSSEIDRSTLEFDAVDLNRVVAQMRDAESSINIIILDACRDNPLKIAELTPGLGEPTMVAEATVSQSTSRTRGLGQTKELTAPTVNVRGLYIAYSTSPGSVAADGDYDNSPYTKALANYIDQPGLGINEIFTKVRSDVIEQTANGQVPWEMSSLTADFYFSSEQTQEEKSNELEIEAEMSRLKEMLKQERQAKIEAEAERQKALVRLKENQDDIALERSLIEQQKLDELEQLRDAQLVKERLRNVAEKAFEAEKKRKQKEITAAKREQLKEIAAAKREQLKEIAAAKREQLKLEKAEKKRLTTVAKAKSADLRKRREAKAKQESIARNQEKARRRSELAELRKIEKLQIEEQEKLARLDAAKEHQAEQRTKNLKEAALKEEIALRKTELRERHIAKAEAKEAKLAEIKLAKLAARQQAAIQHAEVIEAKRVKDKRAKEQKLAAQLAAQEQKLAAQLVAQEQKLAAQLAAQELKLAVQLAAQEQKRIEKLQAAQIAQQKLKEKEAKRLAMFVIEEEERIAREKQLVISMANNCDRLLSNSSSGRKVLNCYRDVLAQDQDNARANNGLLALEKIYQAKIAESLIQGKLNRVNREFAVLENINPVVSKQMFGSSVESLQEKLRKLSKKSSRKVLPTF